MFVLCTLFNKCFTDPIVPSPSPYHVVMVSMQTLPLSLLVLENHLITCESGSQQGGSLQVCYQTVMRISVTFKCGVLSGEDID